MRRFSYILIAIAIFALVTIKIAAAAERIVVLDPAVVEDLYALSAEKNIVAIAHSKMAPIYPNEKTSKLPTVGNILKPSLESIISYKPTLVILGYSNTDMIAKLNNMGIKTQQYPANSIQDIFNNITALGKLTGKEKEAELLVDKKKKQLATIKGKKKLNYKTLFLYSTKPIMAFGEKTLPGEIMNVLGMENIAQEVKLAKDGQPIITPELLAKENPEIIIATAGVRDISSIKASQQLQNTKAYKNNNVFLIDSSTTLRGSIYFIDKIEDMYKKFGSVNVKK